MSEVPDVWITRALPGATATADRVKARGRTPLVQPLIEIVPLDARPDLDGISAIAFTSANGVSAFANLHPERNLRVFAVGRATAAAAKAAGFSRILSSDGDVGVLAAALVARREELNGPILHPGAKEPAGDLAGALEPMGLKVRSLALYDTRSVEPPESLILALPSLDCALLHSPRAAKALAKVLKTHPTPTLRALCLSPAVAEPLRRSKLRSVTFAPLPIESAMLNLMERRGR